jgi:hypothetical protein
MLNLGKRTIKVNIIPNNIVNSGLCHENISFILFVIFTIGSNILAKRKDNLPSLKNYSFPV